MQEAIGLAEAINLTVAHAEISQLKQPRPATLLGLGKVDELRARIEEAPKKIDLVIIDSSLTPVQHRNLEKEWNIKVLDRTALILEIFGERAKSSEGSLQVELAHLTYQRSRLVRSWTHLERQRGGAGFMGGPGERQIESDRRALSEKIVRLRKKIEDVRRTRNLQRRKRKRAPHPVIALVGYTNAGKSTLFNALTDATVMAEDQLFATLDPTMRAVDLPSAIRVIFSDTVGFISNLPTQLVAAFRATLEEVQEADLILHVRDISHPASDAEKADVLSVLSEIGLDGDGPTPVIEVWNKIDLVPADSQKMLQQVARTKSEKALGTLEDSFVVPLSALRGNGLNKLYSDIDRILTLDHQEYICVVPNNNGAALAWLHANAEVLSIDTQRTSQTVSVRISEKTAGQFQKQFGLKLVKNDEETRTLRA